MLLLLHNVGDALVLAGGVVDTYKSFVWEPALVKINAITAATEAACLVCAPPACHAQLSGLSFLGGTERAYPARVLG